MKNHEESHCEECNHNNNNEVKSDSSKESESHKEREENEQKSRGIIHEKIIKKNQDSVIPMNHDL